MPRAEITTTNGESMFTRTVEDARYDDDGLLYIEDKGCSEIIRMASPQFCSVRLIPSPKPGEGPCAVEIHWRELHD